MKQVGIIGWRGMVGSVLLDRMRAEKDFDLIAPTFFSTSQAGAAGPQLGSGLAQVHDANDIAALARLPILISTQGGDYTQSVHPRLRAAGWQGYWIDAASTLRVEKNAVIVLDPVNLEVMQAARAHGIKDFIGGNCTVSLQQMGVLHQSVSALLKNPAASILEIDRAVSAALSAEDFPRAHFDVPLAGSLIPWIDKDLGNGQSREEWKAAAEANKILGSETHPVPIEGSCVRLSAMRCHAQALTIKLTENLPMAEVEKLIGAGNPWVRIVPNNKNDSIRELSPAAVSGKLDIPVGRLRKLSMGGEYLAAFTVGDQLLWGAAEPLRRTLRFLLPHVSP